MAKPRWKQMQYRRTQRLNSQVAHEKYPREQWADWGRMGGGLPWQYRYQMTDAERAEWRAMKRKERAHGSDG